MKHTVSSILPSSSYFNFNFNKSVLCCFLYGLVLVSLINHTSACQAEDLKKLDICQHIFNDDNVDAINAVSDQPLCCLRYRDDDVGGDDPYFNTEALSRDKTPKSSRATCMELQSNSEIMRIPNLIKESDPTKVIYRKHPRFLCASILFGTSLTPQQQQCLRRFPHPSNIQLSIPVTNPFNPGEPTKAEWRETCSKDRKPRTYMSSGLWLSEPRQICLYFHGSGVDGIDKEWLQQPTQFRAHSYLQTFNQYWDNVKTSIRSAESYDQTSLCEPIFFLSNTKYYSWADDKLQRHYCHAIDFLRPRVIFTHSMGNIIIAGGVARQLPGCDKVASTKITTFNPALTYWQSIQGLFKGSSAVIRVAQECIRSSSLFIAFAQYTEAVNFCYPSASSPYTTNHWGVYPAYASMHPQYSNPAKNYALGGSGGVLDVTPEFYCDDDRFSFSYTKTAYDGTTLQVGLSNLYAPADRIPDDLQLYLRVQFGLATSQVLFQFITVLPRDGKIVGPRTYKFPINFINLYDNLDPSDKSQLTTILDKGIIVQLSICQNIKNTGAYDDGKMECYSHMPAGRTHITLNYNWPDKSDIRSLRFQSVPDIVMNARPSQCKPLMDTANEFVDGGLCGTTGGASTFASTESYGLAALTYFITQPSTIGYTTDIFRRNRFNHLMQGPSADYASQTDGMVNVDTCNVRSYGAYFADIALTTKYQSDPTFPFFQSTINHADGQCYRRDSPSDGLFSCSWQINRIKYRVLGQGRRVSSSSSSSSGSSSSGSRGSGSGSSSNALTNNESGLRTVNRDSDVIRKQIYEYINRCVFRYEATTSPDKISTLVIFDTDVQAYLKISSGGHPYIFFKQTIPSSTKFGRIRKQLYDNVLYVLSDLNKVFSSLYERHRKDDDDVKYDMKRYCHGRSFDKFEDSLNDMFRIYNSRSDKDRDYATDIVDALKRQIQSIEDMQSDTEFLHQLQTYDQSTEYLKRKYELSREEWAAIKTLMTRPRDIATTIPRAQHGMIRGTKISMSVVKCLSGIGSSDCAYSYQY